MNKPVAMTWDALNANRCLMRLLALVVLTLLWLVPFTWVGSKLGRLPFRVPDRLWQQYSAAGLFTLRCTSWADWRIEIRKASGDEWSVLDMAVVSPLPSSGYRQRLDRVLGDTHNKKVAENLRQRLAGWIAQRLKEKGGMEINGVRYWHRSWQTNTPETAFPQGRWNGDGVLPETTKATLLKTYGIVDGKAVAERAKPRPPTMMPQPEMFRRKSMTEPAIKK